MQGQAHSMRLRSSVIETRLLGGDRDLMAEVIAEASGGVRVKGVCVLWGVHGDLAVNLFCRLTEFVFACILEMKNHYSVKTVITLDFLSLL